MPGILRGQDENGEDPEVSFVPYIHFRGNCAEAMHLYAGVFGTEAPLIMRYRDAPAGKGAPASDRVMHAEIALGDGRLMAGDFPEGMTGDPQQAVSIMHPVRDPETGRRLFERLADGGEIILAFGPTFWSAGFGMVRDRFGTHRMIAAPEG